MSFKAVPPGVQANIGQVVSPLDRLLESLDESWQRKEAPLRCVSCGNPVTTAAERFSRDGKHAFHFINPEGYQFDICLYQNALGCYPSGEASDYHSWFPPYQWRHAHCGQCDLHLGWRYQSDNGAIFWGLITALLTCEQ